MTSDRWYATNDYARDVFGSEPEHIRSIREAAEVAQLPSIAVTPELGHLLALLMKTTGGERALEIGTLGGYSTLWLLEGMQPSGTIVTVEYEDRHADFCDEHFARLGVDDRISVRRGTALDLLPPIVADLGPASLDLVFIDADKPSYPAYYEMTRDLVKPGGLLLVDNIFGTGSSWIDDLSHPNSDAADRMNRTAASDPDFDAAGLFVRSGLLIARRR
jgi:caffeoyl-CoA O-methyltransferase